MRGGADEKMWLTGTGILFWLACALCLLPDLEASGTVPCSNVINAPRPKDERHKTSWDMFSKRLERNRSAQMDKQQKWQAAAQMLIMSVVHSLNSFSHPLPLMLPVRINHQVSHGIWILYLKRHRKETFPIQVSKRFSDADHVWANV